MTDKKETFSPLHWDEHTEEEKVELEKLMRGEPSQYDMNPKEEIPRRINMEMKKLSDEILKDTQDMIDNLKYNVAQFIIIRKKIKKKLYQAPKDLSYLALKLIREDKK